MNKQSKPNYREGGKQLAKNVAAAGLGSGLGYLAGGHAMSRLVRTKKFRSQYKKLSPQQRKALAAKIRITGTLIGAGAGGLSSHALSKALSKEKTSEKVASFCVHFAERTLV